MWFSGKVLCGGEGLFSTTSAGILSPDQEDDGAFAGGLMLRDTLFPCQDFRCWSFDVILSVVWWFIQIHFETSAFSDIPAG